MEQDKAGLATPRRSGLGLGDALAVVLVTAWGVNFVVVKQALAEMLPMTFNGLRFMGATALLFVLLRLMGEDWRIRRADAPLVVFLGIVGIVVYQVCFIYGLSLSTASNVSLVVNASPTLVVLIAAWRGQRRLGASAWLGAIASLGGLALVIGGRSGGLSFGGATLTGDIIALGATVSWAVYTLAVAPLFGHYSPLKATGIVMLVGTIPLAVLAAPELARQDWGKVTFLGWGALAYSTVFSIALGYVAYYTCIKLLGGARTASYLNLTPVFSVLAAVALLGERMSPLQSVGAAIVLGGIYLIRRA